jgi:CDP-paratose 2-epimerase
LSLLELLDLLGSELGRPVARSFGDWRPGDQRVYISDVGKAGRLLGWQPAIAPADGVRALIDWHAQRQEAAA